MPRKSRAREEHDAWQALWAAIEAAAKAGDSDAARVVTLRQIAETVQARADERWNIATDAAEAWQEADQENAAEWNPNDWDDEP